MKKKFVLLFVVLSVVFSFCLVSGCDSSDDNYSGGSAYIESTEENVSSASKIVYSVKLSLDAEDSTDSQNSLMQIADKYGCKFRYSDYYEYQDGDSFLSIGFYVPTEQVNAMVSEIESKFETKSKIQESKDIGSGYNAVCTEKQALLERKSTLEEFLSEAVTLEEKLSVEEKLFDVNGKINEIDKRIAAADELSAYSTVSITLSDYEDDDADGLVALFIIMLFVIGGLVATTTIFACKYSRAKTKNKIIISKQLESEKTNSNQ